MADFSSLKQTIQTYIKQNGNEEITGNILQDVLLAMVSTMGDGAINSLASALQDEITARQNQDATLQGNIAAEATARQNQDAILQGNINAEATARRDADTALGGRIDGLQTAVNGINTKLAEGYIYAGIATPSTNPSNPSGKVFYIATAAGTYTNFLDGNSSALVLTRGINMLKYSGTAWSYEQVIGINSEVTKDSQDLIDNGAVYDECQKLDPLVELFKTVGLEGWGFAENYNVNINASDHFVVIAPLQEYNTYYKVLDKECSFSAQAEKNAYYAIAYGEGASEFTPPSGSNTTYILCNTTPVRVRKSENNLPTDANPITLPAGSIVCVSVYYTDIALIRQKMYSDSQKADYVSIEKIDASNYAIDLGKYQLTLSYIKNQSTNSDSWNLLSLRSNGAQLTMGDILGVIKEQGEDDYMGGVHGDEKNVGLMIRCDGFSWDRVSKTLCRRLSIDMISEIYRVSSKAHIYNRIVHIELTPNKIRIENNFIALATSVVEAAYNGGLIDCKQENLTALVMPNYYSDVAPTTQPNNNSKDNVSGTMYWVGGSITIKNIRGCERPTFRGYDFVYAVGGVVQRNKIYMGLIADGSSVTLNAGEELCGICEYELY